MLDVLPSVLADIVTDYAMCGWRYDRFVSNFEHEMGYIRALRGMHYDDYVNRLRPTQWDGLEEIPKIWSGIHNIHISQIPRHMHDHDRRWIRYPLH
jgi:hypothetical protein